MVLTFRGPKKQCIELFPYTQYWLEFSNQKSFQDWQIEFIASHACPNILNPSIVPNNQNPPSIIARPLIGQSSVRSRFINPPPCFPSFRFHAINSICQFWCQAYGNFFLPCSLLFTGQNLDSSCFNSCIMVIILWRDVIETKNF